MADYTENFVQTLHELYKQQATGILFCVSVKSEASIFIIGGTVLYIHPGKGFGDLTKYLRKHELISEQEMSDTYRVAAGKKSIEQALIEADVVTDRKMWHLRYRYQHSILKSLLRWKSGTLRFKRFSIDRETVVDNELFQHSSVPSLLWKMVAKGMQKDQVLPSLLDSDKGSFVFPERCAAEIATFDFPNNISKLHTYEGQTVSLQGITSAIVDTSGDLLKALWLLCLLGVTRREKDSYAPIAIDERDLDQVKRPNNPEKPTMQEEKTKKWISAVHRDYRRVMNKDYYSFLKLREETSLKDIEDRCTNRRKMLRHMRKNIPNLDEKTDQMIQELLDAIDLVWHHLGEPQRRREYDRVPLLTAASEI